MPEVTRPSVAFAVLDGVLLIAHGTEPPADDDWDRLVEMSLKMYRSTLVGRTLVTSEGGAPTAEQRHRLDRRVRDEVALSGEPRARIAIMSHSAFVRAVVTASTLFEDAWFARIARKLRGKDEPSRVYRAFVPSELPQAIAWLGILAVNEAEIKQELERLRNEVAKKVG